MKKHKITDIITIVLFLAVIFGFGVGFWALPDVGMSYAENRQMQAAPSFSGGDYEGMDYLIHGELADDFDEYYCDQFPLRRVFLSLKAVTELAFGRGGNNGVLYSDGALAATRFNAVGFEGETEFYDKDHVVACLKNLNAVLGGLDMPATAILPPRTIDVRAKTFGYPADVLDGLDKLVTDTMDEGLYLGLLDTMRALEAEGQDPYYDTDHHWTVKGAYAAYAALMEEWGITPYAEEDFSFETVTDSFCGSSRRNGNFFFLKGEKLQLARYEGDEDYKVEVLDLGFKVTEEKAGLYDFAALDSDDAYTVFLHGKPVHMRISLEGKDRETLLVIKDSFAHSLVPFLARHFDIVLVDLDESRWGTSLGYVVSTFSPDRVLLVYNYANLIGNEKLKNIK